MIRILRVNKVVGTGKMTNVYNYEKDKCHIFVENKADLEEFRRSMSRECGGATIFMRYQEEPQRQ